MNYIAPQSGWLTAIWYTWLLSNTYTDILSSLHWFSYNSVIISEPKWSNLITIMHKVRMKSGCCQNILLCWGLLCVTCTLRKYVLFLNTSVCLVRNNKCCVAFNTITITFSTHFVSIPAINVLKAENHTTHPRCVRLSSCIYAVAPHPGRHMLTKPDVHVLPHVDFVHPHQNQSGQAGWNIKTNSEPMILLWGQVENN
jgi:hypothetical protein